MTKNLNNHHKELKNAVACVPLNEKNIAQEKRGAMLKNLQNDAKNTSYQLGLSLLTLQRFTSPVHLYYSSIDVAYIR